MSDIIDESYNTHTVFELYGKREALAVFMEDYEADEYAREYETNNNTTCIIIKCAAEGRTL